MANRSLATADVVDRYGNIEPVCIISSRAIAVRNGPQPCAFSAPGWRAMCFTTLDAAMRKLARHPGFTGWRPLP